MYDPNQQQYGGGQGYPPQQQPYGGQQPPYGGQQPPYGGQGYPGQQPYGGYPPQPGFNQPQQPQPGYAGNDPEVKGFDFNDESIRKGFIRKVYFILSCQLLISLAFVCLCTYHSGTNLWVRKHHELFWIAFIVMLVTMISMACCEGVRRTAPTNFIFLGLFTLAETFMLGMMTSRVPQESVLLAVIATAVVCIGLTLFALQTKWDFTVMGGVLFVAVLILMVFGLFAAFFGGNLVHLIYASLGALLFSIYLIYDTQMMMGGKHKYSISPEEYIFAALNLYMDIVNIFIYILTIISSSRD